MSETTKTTEITITKQPETSNNNNNPFFFLTLIPKLLLKPLQMFNKQEKTEKPVKRAVADAEEQSYSKPPDVVRFPVKNQHEVPPIKLDEEDAPRDTNALIQWQVAILSEFIGSGRASETLLMFYYPFAGLAALAILRGLIPPSHKTPKIGKRPALAGMKKRA